MPTKDWNAEMFTEGVNDHFSGYWMYWLLIHEFLILTAAYLVFWTTVPVSRGFYSIKILKEFSRNKCKTLFRIVPTLISVEILYECCRHRSQTTKDEFVSKHRDFLVWHDNFLKSKAKIIIKINWHFQTKIYRFKNDWMSFSVEILGQF